MLTLKSYQFLTKTKKELEYTGWTNIQNGKRYVGSSVDLSRRFSSYFSIKWLTSAVNSVINKALLKSGYSGFKLEILEYCDPKDVIEREQYYIDLLKPEYNVLKVAGSLYGHKHTKETINKIKAAAQNRTRAFFR
jgi:group I intron endonuclease